MTRSSGAEASWSFPTYGDGLPHDLVHLVVESAFAVSNGFWGRVDAGVDVARANEQANRQGGPGKYAAFGEDQRGILLAEALAGLPWPMSDLTEADLLEMLAASCSKMGVEMPGAATIDGLRAVRRTLDSLRAEWRGLVPKGTLEIHFDPGTGAMRR